MFKSLRTAKELFEVLQINELNCFTQQVSTFLFFFFFYCIMDNVYIRFFFFKRLFCKQGCEILHEMRHISANTFKFQQQRHSFTSACFYRLEKKINSIFWQGRQYKNLKYYEWTPSWCWCFETQSNIFHSIICWKKQNLSGPLALDLSWTRTHSVC